MLLANIINFSQPSKLSVNIKLAHICLRSGTPRESFFFQQKIQAKEIIMQHASTIIVSTHRPENNRPRVERAKLKLIQCLRAIGNCPEPQRIESFQQRADIEDFKEFETMKYGSKWREKPKAVTDGDEFRQKRITRTTPKTLKKPESTNNAIKPQAKRQMITDKQSLTLREKITLQQEDTEDDDWAFDINDVGKTRGTGDQRPRKKARKQFVQNVTTYKV